MYGLLYDNEDAEIHSLTENELDSVDFFIPERCHDSENANNGLQVSSISVQNPYNAVQIENRGYKQELHGIIIGRV